MTREIKLYGNGDIDKVVVSREMEVDFNTAYGIELHRYLHRSGFSDTRKFDTKLERMRYERDIIRPIEIETMDRNPEMYPPKGLR